MFTVLRSSSSLNLLVVYTVLRKYSLAIISYISCMCVSRLHSTVCTAVSFTELGGDVADVIRVGA